MAKKKKGYPWQEAPKAEISFKRFGIDCPTLEDFNSFSAELERIGLVSKRSLEQNDCLHKWIRKITQHLNARKVHITEETTKELVLNTLGNTKKIENIPGLPPKVIAMRSSKYKATDAELSPQERRAGFISMNELLSRIEVWAATDLGLDLQTDEPNTVPQSYEGVA